MSAGSLRVKVGRPFKSLRVVDSSALDNMIAYFVDINNKFHGVDFFKKQWESLDRYDLNPKQLSIIIERSGQLVRDFEAQDNDIGYDTARELKSIILGNLHRWERQADKKIEAFNPINLSHAIKGYGDLGIKPSNNIFKKLFARIQERVADFKPIDFSMHYFFAAKMGSELPRTLAKTLIERVRACDSFLRDRNKTDLAWALAVQDSIFPKTEHAQLAGLVRPMLPREIRGEHVQKMRHDTAKWFAWDGDFKNVDRKPTHSPVEDDVRGVFERAGLNVEVLESPIPAFPQAIDCTVSDGLHAVHVEIDAHSSHHLEAAGHVPLLKMNPFYAGKDLFRSALLDRETDTPILRVPRPIAYALAGKRNGRLSLNDECAALMAKIFFDKAAHGKPTVSRAMLLGTDPDVRQLVPSRP